MTTPTLTSQHKEFIAIYEQYADAIFRYCYMRAYNRETAKDLVQETFVRTWKYIAAGKTIEHYRPFLYRTATNLIIDETRKCKTISLDNLQENGLSARLHLMVDMREQLETTIEAKKVLETITKLNKKYRDVIMMRYVDEFSVKEIANMQGKPENTVHVMLSRGAKKLRRLLVQDQATLQNTA